MTPADRLAAFEDFLREELSLPRFREAQAHLAGIRASVRVASPTAPDKVARSMEKIAGVMRERDLRPDIAFSEIQDWLTIAGYDVPLRSCALKCPHGEGTNCAACVRAVCSPTAPEEIIEIDEAGVVHPKGRMVKDASGRYVKSTVLRDPEPEGPCVALTAPDIRNPFEDEGWRNAMVQQFHDEWHHTKPADRKDIVRAFINFLRRFVGSVPTAPDLRDALERIANWQPNPALSGSSPSKVAAFDDVREVAWAALQERPTVAPKEPGHAD